ncbi:MAG: FAD-dependent oxidoreductase [Leptospiraceae bacterium]|nr:FAD-dependent oxidoreductase [Leptospiraceae bacterium]
MKIYIIGGGVTGLAAAAELARFGEVIVLEAGSDIFQFTSGKSAGIARSYEAHPVLSKLAKQSLLNLFEISKQYPTIFEPTGLYIKPLEYDYFSLHPFDEVAGYQQLIPAEKQYELADGSLFKGLFIPGNGILNTIEVARYWRENCLAKNIKILTSTKLLETRIKNRFIEELVVQTGPYADSFAIQKNDLLVFSNGSWAADKAVLRTEWHPPVIPHKRHLYKLRPKSGQLPEKMPVIWDETTDCYFRKEEECILATHADQTPTSVDDYTADSNEYNTFSKNFYSVFPFAREFELVSERACLRTYSLDNLPVIGFDPYLKNLFWNVSWGGRGLSISFAAGRILAQIFEQGWHSSESQTVNPFTPHRFI